MGEVCHYNTWNFLLKPVVYKGSGTANCNLCKERLMCDLEAQSGANSSLLKNK